MNPKRSKENAAKLKLGKFSSGIYDDDDIPVGPFGQRDDNNNMPSNWKFAILGCGSNAFGQLFIDDIMCSKLQHIPIPVSSKKHPDSEIEQISTGSSITSAVLSQGGGLYCWGSSGTASYRTPLPMKIDPRCVVKQVSCGESHSAFISQTGKVFTVGSGEHGALGHGNKTTLTTPKIVAALAKLKCLQVSCGPYHTAFIAGEESDIGFVRIPPSAAPVNVYEEWEGSPGGRFDRVQDGALLCARLFSCGIGKAGQLGLGDNAAMMKTPREVTWFSDNGHRVGKVSCGMHHTVVIAIPVHAMRMFITTVFTFGWGEHGRLGHGNENNCKIPTEVTFPEPFHAIDVSAGEQHTLATSGRENGCYAWGNNAFGQCAAGSPSSAEFSLSPNKVPIPEGIRVVKVTAGGRHSAAISSCEKLLLWGWGEEGQLGNGTEKDSWLPRPVRLPEIQGQKCLPMTVALGMCHTVVAVRNKNYVYTPTVEEVEVEVKEEEQESVYLPIVSNVCNTVESSLSCALSPAPILPEKILLKQSVFMLEENIEESKPIQSLKDILSSRETRETENREMNTVLNKYSSQPEPEIEPEEVQPPPVEHDQKVEHDEEDEEEEVVKEKTDTVDTTQPPNVKEKQHLDKYFYKEGQNLDNCYVANSARRAELRKQKKSASTPAAAATAATAHSHGHVPVPPPAAGGKHKSATAFHRRPSK